MLWRALDIAWRPACAVACGRNCFEMLLKEHSTRITRQKVCSCGVLPMNNNHTEKIYKYFSTLVIKTFSSSLSSFPGDISPWCLQQCFLYVKGPQLAKACSHWKKTPSQGKTITLYYTNRHFNSNECLWSTLIVEGTPSDSLEKFFVFFCMEPSKISCL